MKEIFMSKLDESFLISVLSADPSDIESAREFILKPRRERDEAMGELERIKSLLENFLSETTVTICGSGPSRKVELYPYSEKSKDAYDQLREEFRGDD